MTKDEIWANYQKDTHCFIKKMFSGADEWIAPLPKSAKREIEQLKSKDPKYKNLDDSVLYALYASRQAVEQAGWSEDGVYDEPNSTTNGHGVKPGSPTSGRGVEDAFRFGVNIGSSRGATTLFEK